MKIRSLNHSIVNMRLFVPIDGIINIDADGQADVSAKCAVALVKTTSDWEFVKSSDSSTVQTPAQQTPPVNQASQVDPEEQKLIDGLQNLTVDQMIEMAKEAGYPETEWGVIKNQKLFASYLLSKYKAATTK